MMNERSRFLPVSRADMQARGWEEVDFVLVSGDAYVDHPSFGHAIIGRVLEKAGYRVAILAQPDWRNGADFKRFGKPRLAFLVTAGNIDSMVNHYTAARRKRSEDAYSPGGKAGLRPDRATIAYCGRAREAFSGVPIIIGGVEASLRRMAHYDYWDDAVRRSILVDSGANLLVYGMGETPILDVAKALDRGERVPRGIRGTCILTRQIDAIADAVMVDSFEQVSKNRKLYAQSFAAIDHEQDPIRGRTLIQPHGSWYLVQYPPCMPLSQRQLDAVYTLPFQRVWHPDYDALGGIPAIEEVQFSISATRGCYGGCSFCALTYHQGRIVQARSHPSVIQEAKLLTHLPGFKGYIHDVGGPTANFRRPACSDQLKRGACAEKQCMYPSPCKKLDKGDREFIELLRELRTIPGIKKVFVRSGLRYDAMLLDKNDALLKELCEHHISGQLKVAPEHISPRVLRAMGKPSAQVYREFVKRYRTINEHLGKQQYLVPYFISGHPGSDLYAAIELAEFMRDERIRPEQVQDFYPTPGTRATCMYYTGLDPLTMEPIHIPQGEEKAMQRALLQYSRSQNWPLVRKALLQAGREDLIGYGRHVLVPPPLTAKSSRPTSERRPSANKHEKAHKPRGRRLR